MRIEERKVCLCEAEQQTAGRPASPKTNNPPAGGEYCFGGLVGDSPWGYKHKTS